MPDRAIRDELRLRDLFDLPIEKCPAAADEVLAIVWRLLRPFEPYVRRLASSKARPHEVEDVAVDVLTAAAEQLKLQFGDPGTPHSR